MHVKIGKSLNVLIMWVSYFHIFLVVTCLLFCSVSVSESLTCFKGTKNIRNVFKGDSSNTCDGPKVCLVGNFSIIGNRAKKVKTWTLEYDCNTEKSWRLNKEINESAEVHQVWTCSEDKCNDPRSATCNHPHEKTYKSKKCLTPQCVTNKHKNANATNINTFDFRESYYCSTEHAIVPFSKRSFGLDRVEVFCYNAGNTACNRINKAYETSSGADMNRSSPNLLLVYFTLTLNFVFKVKVF